MVRLSPSPVDGGDEARLSAARRRASPSSGGRERRRLGRHSQRGNARGGERRRRRWRRSRQKARLLPDAARARRGVARTPMRGLDARPGLAGGSTGATSSARPPSRCLPVRDLAREAPARARCGARPRGAPRARARRARIRRRRAWPSSARYGVVVAHRSRQSLSFNSPRRIQLFMVPSGTLMRSASSS